MKKIATSIEIVSTSLVSMSGTPPHRHGNYFDVAINNEPFESRVRIVNCFVENFRHVMPIKDLQLEVIGTCAFINDERFPKEYLYNGICVSGRGYDSISQLKEMYDFAQKSYENELCGCELEEDNPHIWRKGPSDKAIYHCARCDREWN